MALTVETATLRLTRIETPAQLADDPPRARSEVEDLASQNGRTVVGWGRAGDKHFAIVRVNASGAMERWLVQAI